MSVSHIYYVPLLNPLGNPGDCGFSVSPEASRQSLNSLFVSSSPRSQRRDAERWVGSARRELLDPVIVLNENHLRRLLREYVDYYNNDRVHTELQDSPVGRPTEHRPSPKAQIIGIPRVGVLGSFASSHHRYEWREAA